MEKVMLPVSKADILQAISKFPKKDYEALLREIDIPHIVGFDQDFDEVEGIERIGKP